METEALGVSGSLFRERFLAGMPSRFVDDHNERGICVSNGIDYLTAQSSADFKDELLNQALK
jgi:hypothetical protein